MASTPAYTLSLKDLKAMVGPPYAVSRAALGPEGVPMPQGPRPCKRDVPAHPYPRDAAPANSSSSCRRVSSPPAAVAGRAVQQRAQGLQHAVREPRRARPTRRGWLAQQLPVDRRALRCAHHSPHELLQAQPGGLLCQQDRAAGQQALAPRRQWGSGKPGRQPRPRFSLQACIGGRAVAKWRQTNKRARRRVPALMMGMGLVHQLVQLRHAISVCMAHDLWAMVCAGYGT